MIPFVFGLNAITFGACNFSGLVPFLLRYALTTSYIFGIYLVYRSVAMLIRKRFPYNSDLFRRIAAMLPIFFLMNILMVSGLYAFHDLFPFHGCNSLFQHFWWVYLFSCISSITIVLINEAVANWKGWKKSVTETEKLRNAYQKTKLIGLKGQVNPHFLFNCFNSLSSLIAEDESEAEKFLNEMTRVHRYMLRGDDEFLVSVEEELKFVQSYVYLIKARFGPAIQVILEVSPADRQQHLPPLSLQVVLENIIYSNAASQEAPLCIYIGSRGQNKLLIRNNVNHKSRHDGMDYDEGLDNLINKYRLLNELMVEIIESAEQREIILPLIIEKEVVI
ncbi:putative two-component histidine kinase [Flavihumibacter petaseus NBRC 106054]|uniref:Putative two-component histidine kinase n=2 Tax=Flavihumibacter TaxID=1004301 RepID=A0A0E9MWJ9_9BACT|nr:putative two-component histidine kinase [Flavihumibacter petaseus NBRC 106054]